jgi:geranylgeranyl diphosphate synthase type II
MPGLDAIDPNTTDRGTALLERAAREVEQWMQQWKGWSSLPPALAQAGQYGVLGGGKRLRPALVLGAAEACGGNRAESMPAAAAMELVHCFSLVHDDLPALDDDQLRRGRPTLHVHAGEAMAILAGDLLLTQAFQILACGSWPSDVAVDLIRMLSDDTVEMVAGQVYDTLGGLPENLSPIEQLRLTQRCKTGALIRCAVSMGARVANAPPEQTNALHRYGDAIGLMFQVVDDLLDVTQSAEHIGKAVGKDAAMGRLTWPGLLGQDGSIAQIELLHAQAVEALKPLGPNGAHLKDLAGTLAVRTR